MKSPFDCRKGTEPDGSEAGLALVEVLVSLSLLALIASSVTLMLYQLTGLQTRVYQKDHSDEVIRIRGVIRQALEASIQQGEAFAISGDEAALQVSFQGSLGPLPYAKYEVELSPDRGADGGEFYQLRLVSVETARDDEVEIIRALPAALAINGLSYFGADAGTDNRSWRRDWKHSYSPELIAIEFVQTGEQGQPPLIIGG